MQQKAVYIADPIHDPEGHDAYKSLKEYENQILKHGAKLQNFSSRIFFATV